MKGYGWRIKNDLRIKMACYYIYHLSPVNVFKVLVRSESKFTLMVLSASSIIRRLSWERCVRFSAPCPHLGRFTWYSGSIRVTNVPTTVRHSVILIVCRQHPIRCYDLHWNIKKMFIQVTWRGAKKTYFFRYICRNRFFFKILYWVCMV